MKLILLGLFSVITLIGNCQSIDDLRGQVVPVDCPLDFNYNYTSGFFVSYKAKCYFITNWFTITGRDVFNLHFRDPTGKKRSPTQMIASIYFKSLPNPHLVNFDIKTSDFLEYRDKSGIVYDVTAVELPENYLTAQYDVKFYDLDVLKEKQLSNGAVITMVGISYDFTFETQINYSAFKMNASVIVNPSLEENKLKTPRIYCSSTTGWGLAGAPVFDSEGQIAGIFSSIIKTSRLNSDSIVGEMGGIWAISAIKKVLDLGKPVDWNKLPKQ